MAFGTVPRKNVLLLSCMDCRLLDNTVDFMNAYNLENRYDQLVFAGTSLGVLHGGSPPAFPDKKSNAEDSDSPPLSAWKDVFFHQLVAAINNLKRDIRDVFILEHRDCGAYKVITGGHHQPWYDDSVDQQKQEKKDHQRYARKLAKLIKEFSEAEAARHPEDSDLAKKWKDLQVRGFLMDLCGSVKELRLSAAKE